MSSSFMHIGKFAVAPKSIDRFIQVMKDYEHFATQNGLERSLLVKDEKMEGVFMHVTVWNSRKDWVAIEASPQHKNMHQERDALLAEPMEHDFVCGEVLAQ